MAHIYGADWLIVAVAALLIGISKTGLPGIGILAILLVAWVIPAKASTGVILPMLIVGDIIAVTYYHRHAVWRHLLRLFPWAMIGIVLGYLVMGRISDDQLRPMIGLTVLVMLGLNYWRNVRVSGEIPTSWWFAAVIGLLAGMTTMLANAAGPIMIIYLLAMRMPKNEFLGTGAWYFLLMNCFKVPFSLDLNLINSYSLLLNLVNLPMIVFGALLGVRLLKFIPERKFALAVQVLAVAAAIKLLF